MNQTSVDSLQSMEVEKFTIPILPTIQFGSFDPIEVEQKIAPSTLQKYEYKDEKSLQSDVDDEGWTLITRR